MSDATLFDQFAPAVRRFAGDPESRELLIAKDGNISVYYAPFEWVNPSARVIIVGITPGRIQAINALREARQQMCMGVAEDVVLVKAKQTGAFSGPLRPNLVGMLDYIGLDRWLNIPGTATLFNSRSDLLQTASVLQYPVFIEGRRDGNYNGSPNIAATPLLRDILLRFFCPMVNSLPAAVVIPLGDVPAKAIQWLSETGRIQPKAVLLGLPHPSGANAERISYFLGRKPRSKLSGKTNPDKIDAARAALISTVAALEPIQ